MPEPPARVRYRFGVFEADLRSGELRKGGTRLRLQEQPFQVLLSLLERPGDVVTREELRLKLWPADTFVDFDHGLNTAVNKLREALGDSATNPRFIETLARRGYRFIAPVAAETDSGAALPAAAFQGAAPAPADPADRARASPIIQAEEPLHELGIPRPNRMLARALFIAIQFMFLGFYIAAVWKLEPIHTEISEAIGRGAGVVVALIVLTALIGIAVRLYLTMAVAFDFRNAGMMFARIYPWLAAADTLWAMAPLLMLRILGWGLALAAVAALVTIPFAQRTLMRMAYAWPRTSRANPE